MSAALQRLFGLVLDDGRRWGDAAESWQVEDATAILEPGDGPRLSFLTRPKGGSKSTDLGGVALSWLLEQASPGVEGYALAADEDQAARLIGKAAGFVRRSPVLRSLVDVQALRVVNRASGASLVALPADLSGNQGLLSPFFVVDELTNWPSTRVARETWLSVISELPKVPGARLVAMGHAGAPTHWSAKVLATARSLPAHWRVHEVPGPLPWRTSAELEFQRASLPESMFRRRHLNEWASGEDRLTTVDALEQCVRDDDLPLPYYRGLRYVIALDVGLKNDRTVAAVCHREEDRKSDGAGFAATVRAQRVVVDRMRVWQGSRDRPVELREVEEWVAQASRMYAAPPSGRVPVVLDPWQAMGTLQRLRARGVPAEEFTFSAQSVGRLASTLHMLLRNRALSLPRDAGLLDELANVRLRETSPGVVRMDHDPDRHDDRAITLALAAVYLLDEKPQPVEVLLPPSLPFTSGLLEAGF